MLFRVPLPSCSTVCSVQKIQNWPMKTFKITSCTEFKVSAPQALEFRTPLFPHLVPPAIMVWIFVWKYIFNLHSLLRNYLKLFGEDSRVLIHFITFTNSSKLLTEKLPKYSKPRSFWEGGFAPRPPLPGLSPGPAGDLKRSPDSSPTFVPHNTKSWIRPWRWPLIPYYVFQGLVYYLTCKWRLRPSTP